MITPKEFESACRNTEIDNWTLLKPQGIFALVAPKKIAGTTRDGSPIEVPMPDVAAFDPTTESFRLRDGRVVRLLAPSDEYEKAFPGSRAGILADAKENLPHEAIPALLEAAP